MDAFSRNMTVSIFGAAALLAHAPCAAAQGVAPEYRESWAEYQALKAKANGGTAHTRSSVPDWSGVWRRVIDPKAPSPATAAMLTPKYKAAFEAKLARIAKGVEWDRLSDCLPGGMPRWMFQTFLRDFATSPGQTWMNYEQLQETRRIYTDGRGHVPEAVAIPLWDGDSIGFWDGDTLVVHTVHVKAGEYLRSQPDYSFKTSTVERYRKVDPDTLEADFTVYDPESLVRPMRLGVRYGRVKDPDVRISYNSCEEGNNAVKTPEGGTTFILPGEPGYQDPLTFGIPPVALDSMPK